LQPDISTPFCVEPSVDPSPETSPEPRDGLAIISEGVAVKISVGEATAKGEIRLQLWIKDTFHKPHTRALVSVLTQGSQGHSLSSEEIVEVLDEQGNTAFPRRFCKDNSCTKEHCKDWNDFYRRHKKKFQMMVANVRFDLKKYPYPYSTGG
jgi:hypothetical protein